METSHRNLLPHMNALSLSHLDLQTALRGIYLSLALFATYRILLAAYNVYFSPLRLFPGPKIAAASYLPFYYRKFFGTLNPWYLELHSQYGEVVRFTPNDLSFTNEHAYKDIYGGKTANHTANPKSGSFYTKTYGNTWTMLTEPDDTRHGQIRKVFANAFSDRALKLQEPLILKLYNFATFDIMADLTFSEPLGLLQSNQYTPWVKAMFASIRNNQKTKVFKAIPVLRALAFLFLPRNFKKIMKENYRNSVERVNYRIANPPADYDMWKLVLEKGTDVLQPAEMHTNAAIFMKAGTETTATALSGLTYHLLRNPDKLAKVVAEVRAQPDEASLNLLTLPRLRYLNACFEEGLRIYPPVAEGLPREVPAGGNVICGQYIPPKTRMWVPQYVNNRNPRNFMDADKFIPERWLDGEGYDSDKKHALQPFSTGPRNCIGKNLAYHEMRVILAKLLWHFDLRLAERSSNWAEQKTYILWEKPELYVIAEPVR
ncbi:cytochrome P450 [Pseudovirgaria hyperparasitica]|uniref:Cytochrome P450 n=1 Tax=Pseudovirgaria hyperparasitica TaxID=470096 RepID=A0A6A6WAP7_9PEZI|nr:cytochrome P450 [Pseudovirgaria hyperparasitica]KAF2758906.1 cytochrome P450 [Pseudovirgaria hyperparasitica]